MLELPMVIINVQRGGPSTGLPTKTEQADLLQAVNGRNGEAPIPVLAASSPADCFFTAIEAVKIATRYMTPVILLSDGYIANGAEPWKFPKASDIPTIEIPNRGYKSSEKFEPYARDEKLARHWVTPGTSGLEHRIGGLEKEDITGNVSYDPENHEYMVNLRAKKIEGIKESYEPLKVVQGSDSGSVLVLGWGSTMGAIKVAVRNALAEGISVSQLHLRHLLPFPKDLGDILNSFDHILVPELNRGQLLKLLKQEFKAEFHGIHKIQDSPSARLICLIRL
jgi:2-oxoglutarate ferredoxin oxidoreductase subunit alpha